jgi:glycosyltransferase involved in cell wall biosynthesis
MSEVYFYKGFSGFSGNQTTINRIASYFPKSIQTYNLDNINRKTVIGIHAYNSGLFMINKNFNYIIILGGTDINKDINIPYKRSVIEMCIKNATFVVVFNNYMLTKIRTYFPKLSNIVIIPQAVPRILIDKIDIRNELSIFDKRKIFLMAGNLRPVKDPLFLIKMFEKLWFQDRTTLIIVGKNQENYQFSNGVKFLGPKNINIVHSIMQQVDGLINTSIEEGMSSSILEAMKLSCPVYARSNCGNLAITKHLYSGFIFETPGEFEKLLKLPTDEVKKNALEYVNKRHTRKIEKDSYTKLIDLMNKYKHIQI